MKELVLGGQSHYNMWMCEPCELGSNMVFSPPLSLWHVWYVQACWPALPKGHLLTNRYRLRKSFCPTYLLSSRLCISPLDCTRRGSPYRACSYSYFTWPGKNTDLIWLLFLHYLSLIVWATKRGVCRTRSQQSNVDCTAFKWPFRNHLLDCLLRSVCIGYETGYIILFEGFGPWTTVFTPFWTWKSIWYVQHPPVLPIMLGFSC